MKRRAKSLFAGLVSASIALSGMQMISATEGDATETPAAHTYLVMQIPEETMETTEGEMSAEMETSAEETSEAKTSDAVTEEEIGDPAEEAVLMLLTEKWEVYTEEETSEEAESTFEATSEEFENTSEVETSETETEEVSSEEENSEAEEEPYCVDFSACFETKASVEETSEPEAEEVSSEEASEPETEEETSEAEETVPYDVYRLFAGEYESAECFEVISCDQYELIFFVENDAEVWWCYTEESEDEMSFWMEAVETYEVPVEDQTRTVASVVGNHWAIVHVAWIANEEEIAESASVSLEGDIYIEETIPETTLADIQAPSTTTTQVTVTTTAPITTVQPTTAAPTVSPTQMPTTAAPTMPPTTQAPTVPPTTQAPTTAASTVPPTTAAPTTTAHEHVWTPVTQVVHHDAVYQSVWVEDTPAWDEQVLVSAAWDENVLVSAAWDEPEYGWVGVCNECGHQFWTPEDNIHVHMAAGCWASWHDEWLQIGTIHHDAVYQTVHHDAVYQTVHHDAVGHNESVVSQPAWDETVVTGHSCTCGAVTP